MPWETPSKFTRSRRPQIGARKIVAPLRTRIFCGIPLARFATARVRDVFRLEAIARGGRDSVDLRSPSTATRTLSIKVYGARERGLDELMPLLKTVDCASEIRSSSRVDTRGVHFSSVVFPSPRWRWRRNLLPSKKPLRRRWMRSCRAGRRRRAQRIDHNDGAPLERHRPASGRTATITSSSAAVLDAIRFHQALLGNPGIAQLLYRYFEARFEPNGRWRDSAQRQDRSFIADPLEFIAAWIKSTISTRTAFCAMSSI